MSSGFTFGDSLCQIMLLIGSCILQLNLQRRDLFVCSQLVDRITLVRGSRRWIQVIWKCSSHETLSVVTCTFDRCAWTPRNARCATARAPERYKYSQWWRSGARVGSARQWRKSTVKERRPRWRRLSKCRKHFNNYRRGKARSTRGLRRI